MRLRLVIPAALAAAATYAALVRDERAAERAAPATPPSPEPTWSQVSVPSVADVAPPVAAPAAEPIATTPPASAPPPTLSQFEDMAPAAAPSQPSVYDLLAGTPTAEPGAEPPAPGDPPPAEAVEPTEQAEPAAPADPWSVPLDEGRFALGGWAASSGHTMVSAVTFRKRLPQDIAPDRIVLAIDASDNVPDGGLMVLSEPGFAPDRDGFTLLLAAAEPGPFSAAGSYQVLPA